MRFTYGTHSLFFRRCFCCCWFASNAKSMSTPLRSDPRFLTAGPFFSDRFTARYARRNYAANFYARFIFFFPRTHTCARTSETVFRNNVTDHWQIGRKHKYRPFESLKPEYVFSFLREPILFKQNGNCNFVHFFCK